MFFFGYRMDSVNLPLPRAWYFFFSQFLFGFSFVISSSLFYTLVFIRISSGTSSIESRGDLSFSECSIQEELISMVYFSIGAFVLGPVPCSISY